MVAYGLFVCVCVACVVMFGARAVGVGEFVAEIAGTGGFAVTLMYLDRLERAEHDS